MTLKFASERAEACRLISSVANIARSLLFKSWGDTYSSESKSQIIENGRRITVTVTVEIKEIDSPSLDPNEKESENKE